MAERAGFLHAAGMAAGQQPPGPQRPGLRWDMGEMDGTRCGPQVTLGALVEPRQPREACPCLQKKPQRAQKVTEGTWQHGC